MSPSSSAVIDSIRRQVPSGRLAVAFSGGVDSALLLALAVRALGAERVLAVTADSASLASGELETCRRLAKELGAPLRVLETRELDRPDYVANAGDRCYHCKSELFDCIEGIKAEEGIVAVAYGATADDLGDHRPGMQAAREAKILAPLLDAGLGKSAIRELSRELGLETWDKPAQPCLASRVPYGQRVTAARLARIDRAEAAVRRHGFRELRVRDHEQARGGPIARVEVPTADLPRILDEATRRSVVDDLRALGYQYVAIDLEGFRSGRLNEALTAGARALPVAGVTQ